MPGLRHILDTAPSDTQQQKDLRASCIASIGTIFESVKDQPEVCAPDAHAVMEAFITVLKGVATNQD